MKHFTWCHDILHNTIQCNGTQRNVLDCDTQLSVMVRLTVSFDMLRVMLGFILLSVIMLGVIILGIVMLGVVMLSNNVKNVIMPALLW